MTAQSRTMSLVETVANVGSGVVTAVAVGQLIYPLFGYAVSVADNFLITCAFTVVSVARGYAWRRLFNWLHHKGGAA